MVRNLDLPILIACPSNELGAAAWIGERHKYVYRRCYEQCKIAFFCHPFILQHFEIISIYFALTASRRWQRLLDCWTSVIEEKIIFLQEVLEEISLGGCAVCAASIQLYSERMGKRLKPYNYEWLTITFTYTHMLSNSYDVPSAPEIEETPSRSSYGWSAWISTLMTKKNALYYL